MYTDVVREPSRCKGNRGQSETEVGGPLGRSLTVLPDVELAVLTLAQRDSNNGGPRPDHRT